VTTALHVGLPLVLAALVGFVSFKVGRRWRREYSAAKALRLHLDNENKVLTDANADLRAQITVHASGNVVQIGADVLGRNEREFHAGPGAYGSPGLWVPPAVRAGLDSGPRVREGLTDRDNVEVPVGVVDQRAPQLAGKHAHRGGDVRRPVDSAGSGDHGES
jgi:hypothetical protein